MTTVEEFSPNLPHYIDSSMLSTWRACKRKGFWSVINALYPTGKSVHLIAGAAFAAGMEAARKHAFTNRSDASLDRLCEAALPAFLREWGDYVPPEASTKSLVNTFSALRAYLADYHPLTDVVQPHIREDGSPSVEYTFAVPLDSDQFPRHPDGQPFVFVGRFDMLAEFGSDNLAVIVDEKTTSSLGFDWESQWPLRGQFIGYTWALQELGYSLQHALIRGVGIYKTQYKVLTALVHYPEHIVWRWHAELIRTLVDITETWREWKSHERPGKPGLHEGFWEMNLADSCSSYGGCAFLPLCLARDPTPYFSNYIRHRWDPLARNPVSELPAASTQPQVETEATIDGKLSPCNEDFSFQPLSDSFSDSERAQLEASLSPGATSRLPPSPAPQVTPLPKLEPPSLLEQLEAASRQVLDATLVPAALMGSEPLLELKPATTGVAFRALGSVSAPESTSTTPGTFSEEEDSASPITPISTR